MKPLHGSELAATLKLAQKESVVKLAKQGMTPCLAIVQIKNDPVINTYVGLKKRYGADIGVVVEVHETTQSKAGEVIKTLNSDESVHGVIVQLPLENTAQTDQILALVSPSKNVDGLGPEPLFEPATPKAILALLKTNQVSLDDKKILIIGRGRLVGRPLSLMLSELGADIWMVGRSTQNLGELVGFADIVITATGSPGLITSKMLKKGVVVVDAGSSSEAGKTVGDVDAEVYKRSDISITPPKGGVGPLTVCALFDNLLLSAKAQVF